MFWDEKEIGADQPIAEKIRRHFMNQNAYRQPTVDIDSDSSAGSAAELDLSESFEQILERRRTELKNKHTNYQPIVSGNGGAASCSRASTSVLNRLLTDIDLNDGAANDAAMTPPTRPQQQQRSVQPSDDETQLQDVLEPSMFDMLSPCKRVGLMRPSTVLEDSFGELEDYSAANSIAERTENDDGADGKNIDTSFATAQSKPNTDSGHSTSFGTFSRRTSSARRTSASTSSANFTRDSLAVSTATAPATDGEDDSLNIPTTATPVALAAHSSEAAFDDTLEVVEYDHSASKYVLKPVVARRSTPKRQRPTTDSESSASSDSDSDKGDVVLVSDSDPETSYHTANTNVIGNRTPKVESHSFQSDALFPKARSFYADESLDEMAREVLQKHEQSGVVISLDESDEDDLKVAATEQSQVVGHEVDDELECRSSLYSERNDANDDSGSTISVGHSVSQREPNVGGADGDFGEDSFALDACIPDTFNDTIERMDYLMDLGRKIQLKEQRKMQEAASASGGGVSSAASTVSMASSSSMTQRATSVPSSPRSATPTKTPKASTSKTPINSKPTLLKQVTTAAVAAAARNSPRPLARTAAPTLAPLSQKKTPRPAAVLAKNSPILKSKLSANNSPAAKPSPMFKKPTHLAPTSTLSGSKLKTTPQSTTSALSRIPKPSSAGRAGPMGAGKVAGGSSAFDYVVSPIGAYIGKRAPNPMLQNVHIVKDFLDSTYCAGASKELDFTLPTADAENAPPKPQRCRLPQKAYMAADRKQIIDKRRQIIPGGPSVQKLVGIVPTVFTHHGQYNNINMSGSSSSSVDRRADIVADDSFNDMSLAIGDVSVQVVQDPKR